MLEPKFADAPAMVHGDDPWLTVLEAIMQDCSTQQDIFYVRSILDWIRSESTGRENFRHSHPEAFWAIEILVGVFRRYASPRLRSNPPTSSSDLQSIIRILRHQLHQQFACQLSLLSGGVDLDLIIFLSGEKYESSEAKAMTIAIVPSPSAVPAELRFSLKNRLTLDFANSHALRKQLQMAKSGALAIYWDSQSMAFRTVGILTHSADSFFRFVFTGHMKWEFHVPFSGCRMRYQQGRLMLPAVDLSQEHAIRLRNLFSSPDILCTILQAFCNCKGALMIVAPKSIIQKECSRLADKYARGILLERPFPLDLQCSEKLEDQLKRFTSIDGAIFVDTDGFCHACGIILDGKARIPGDPNRGSRFNSTSTYIRSLYTIYPGHKVLGVVKSEDGMLDFFH